MAAAVVSGAVALLLEERPELTPDEVKGALLSKLRDVKGVGGELAIDDARGASGTDLISNEGLTLNELIIPATGLIDYDRASWTRARWNSATDATRASWTRAGWTRAGMTRAGMTRAGMTRAGMTRAGMTAVAWSTSFSK